MTRYMLFFLITASWIVTSCRPVQFEVEVLPRVDQTAPSQPGAPPVRSTPASEPAPEPSDVNALLKRARAWNGMLRSLSPGDEPMVLLMLDYLARNFNPAVGLYREAPNVAPNTYWVYSDGYLAGLDVSRWNAPVLTKTTVLVARAVVPEETFLYTSKNLDLRDGIRSEMHDVTGPRMLDWQEYADRVLWAAMNARNGGDDAREAELMAIANRMWDGTGMDDKIHRVHGFYQTYHVALFYYMTGNKQARQRLVSLQERDPESNRFGGIYTEYGADGKPLAGTDTNIETTAITLRSFLTHMTGR